MLCRSLLTSSAAALVLSGCVLFGPDTVTIGRPLYNVAVQQTNNEQLLLNLVRLRYRDTPLFLEVVSVSSSFEIESSGDARALLSSGRRGIWDLGAGARVMEVPTITYTPLGGEKFVKELLSPIELDTILLLYHSGWSVERILRVCVQSMNELPNAPSASGPTPDRVPIYRDFQRVAHILRELQRARALELGASADGEGLTMRVSRDASNLAVWTELSDLLQLDPNRASYEITTEQGSDDPGTIRVVMRSLVGDFFYLSQGVEVPPADEERGRVTVTRTESGEPFDWRDVTGDLLQVRWSEDQPENSSVRTSYRGVWFYVDDSNLSSKSTFALLALLRQLQAGETPVTGPLLTLPVTR